VQLCLGAHRINHRGRHSGAKETDAMKQTNLVKAAEGEQGVSEAASSSARIADGDTTMAPSDRPARSRGNTYIDDEVISVIARIAAEQVPGIHQIGDSSLRNVFSRFRRHAGVEAEVGLREAAADIEIIVEFGYSMREVAELVRERIIDAIESMTGRYVVEVNVYVVDVFVPKSAGQRRRRELE
ncbi:MAG: Asp23/Gls24 family envelope stress response protein, partial [Myxococcota bacterium]